MSVALHWMSICPLADILPDTGVCAQAGGRQIAIFHVDGAVYAIDNVDPASGASVLSRGIVGDLAGELVVASPLFKQHFSLTTGRCLEDTALSVGTFAARHVDGVVWIGTTEPAPVKTPVANPKLRLVVVGNGMAGMRTVEELLEAAPDLFDIEVFGAEPHGNYNRILLSPVLAGEKQVDDIMLHPLAWYAARGVTLHCADPVIAIDRLRRRVTSKSGIEAVYDRLLIATGSTPVVPQIPGNELSGVVTFRDLHDVEQMLAAAREHTHAVVIGGGLLGLEAANGLMSRGMDVTVVHLHDLIMERQLDKTASTMLKRSLASRGMKFHMPARTRSFSGESRVTGVCFEDGSQLRADLVVIAIGIRPNIGVARAAGLRCDRGIVVDDTLCTDDGSIYAVGECVQHRDRTYGLIAPLWEQAKVCTVHLRSGGAPQYAGTLLSTQLKVTGINLFSAGDIGNTPSSESLVLNDASRGVYKRVIIEDDKVRGAVLYGDTKDGAWYLDMIAQRRSVGRLRNTLLFGEAYSALM